MPTYDFQCESCGKLFEARVSFGDAEQGKLPACPACRSTKPRRLLNSTINILIGKMDTAITRMPGSGGGSCGCH